MQNEKKIIANEKLENEEELIGENAFEIDGVITIPNGVNQDVFFDEFIEWLEIRNSSFFGFTGPVKDESDGNSCIEKILNIRTGINLDKLDIEDS